VFIVRYSNRLIESVSGNSISRQRPAMQDLIGGQFDYFCTISWHPRAAPLQNGLDQRYCRIQARTIAVLPCADSFGAGHGFRLPRPGSLSSRPRHAAPIIKNFVTPARRWKRPRCGSNGHQPNLVVSRQTIDRISASIIGPRDRKNGSAAEARESQSNSFSPARLLISCGKRIGDALWQIAGLRSLLGQRKSRKIVPLGAR